MTGTKRDLILYRLDRAKETLGDAEILAEKQRWNSAINRLYYSVYYAVSALLLNSVCKKTHVFFVFDKKSSRTRLAKFLKTRSLLFVNDCFKNKPNAVFDVFLQRLNNNISPSTHNGVKTQFSIHYIKTGVFPTEMGRIYSQLFTWRQKGDYADLFDFNEEIVLPYFEPVNQLISEVEMNINSTFDQRF